MPAFSSGRPVGPDGLPLDEPQPGAIQSLLGTLAPNIAPPENQQVLDFINQTRGWYDANVNTPGSGQGPFKGNEYFEAAAQPGMSGYFDYDPGRGGITPHQFTPQQSAAFSGQSLGQLAGSIFPGQADAHIGYNVPQNDRGGFFTVQDLFNAGHRDVPTLGTQGASGLSTNNWRLLGRGPGWIMRNGRMININDPAGWRGAWAGAEIGPGGPAESWSPIGSFSNVGSGAWAGMPNNWRGATGWPGQDTPYLYDRPQGTMQG